MRSDKDRLLDILEAIEKIETRTSRGREAFDSDEMLQVWVIHYLQIIGEALPFKYTLAFPILLLLDRLPTDALLPGMRWQLFWAVTMLTISGVLWRKGTRVYSAVGG
jgi:hypothetical protein